MTTLNTAIASAKEAVEKKVCTTAMIPVEDLQVLIDAVEASERSRKVVEAQAEMLKQHNRKIAEWQCKGEKYMKAESLSLMFNLGQWWADRPWRTKK